MIFPDNHPEQVSYGSDETNKDDNHDKPIELVASRDLHKVYTKDEKKTVSSEKSDEQSTQRKKYQDNNINS